MSKTPAKIFCEMMHKERIRRKISTVELAESLKLRSREIDSWEKHKRAPRIGTAIRWAKALGYEFELRRVNK